MKPLTRHDKQVLKIYLVSWCLGTFVNVIALPTWVSSPPGDPPTAFFLYIVIGDYLLIHLLVSAVVLLFSFRDRVMRRFLFVNLLATFDLLMLNLLLFVLIDS